MGGGRDGGDWISDRSLVPDTRKVSVEHKDLIPDGKK